MHSNVYIAALLPVLDRYLSMLEWVMGSMAFYVHPDTTIAMRPSCGYLVSENGATVVHASTNFLVSDGCYTSKDCDYLCEVNYDVKVASSVSHIRLRRPAFTEKHAALLVCPDNSTTHFFLACDVKSACWARAYTASFSCDAPLTPLPPMMTCSNGVQHVPYTLVCDHRPDCDDSSDEDFCSFPRCDEMEAEQFDCGDKQVRCFDRSD